MKKKYIRPESRLYAINLAENIASSVGGGSGGAGGSGDSTSSDIIVVPGYNFITTQLISADGSKCRALYQNLVPVIDSTNLWDIIIHIMSFPDGAAVQANCIM